MLTHIRNRGAQLIRASVTNAQHASRMSSAAAADGPIALRIRTKLAEAFAPVHLDVLNESYMHNVPKGAETHFKVIVVSDAFEGKPLLQRHRMVNAVLEEELAQGVHALSIQGKTPAQWEKNNTVQASPSCMGGMKTDPTKQEFLKSLKDQHQ